MKLNKLIEKYFDILETVFIILFAAGLGTILLQKSYSIYVQYVGSGSLAILYWLRAIQQKKTENVKIKYSKKLVWYSLMIAPIAIFSKVNIYAKSDIFLIFSISLMFVALIIRAYQKITKKAEVPNSDIVRLIVAIIVSLFLYSFPFAS